MLDWNTGDRATDQNLGWIEQLGKEHRPPDAEGFLELVRAVIGVDRMLPERIRRQFALPHLYVGDAPYAWSDATLRERTSALRAALVAGLDKIRSDPEQNRVQASDRRRTRSEQIEEALAAYRASRGSSELHALRIAVSGTNLHHAVEKLERWLKRKRPSPGGQSVEYEIVCALGEIARGAGDYAHLPTTDAH